MIDDRVRPQTAEEKELYKLLSDVTQKPASLLSSCWREPSITIHNIEISGPKGKKKKSAYVYQSLFLLSSEATIIPGTVTARLSLRIVPDQDLDTIVKSLRDYIQTSFNVLQSTNSLKVNSFYDIKII